MTMSNLTLRIITAVVLAIVVLTVLFALPGAPTLSFFTALLLLGVWEWGGFFAAGPVKRGLYVLGAVVLGAVIILLNQLSVPALQAALGAWSYAAACWWLLVAFGLYSRPISYSKPLVAAAGYLCLLFAWLGLLLVFARPAGPWLFVWMVLIIAAADIGAYFTGKAVGRRKLAPELSPGKTLEGLIGGLVAATLVAMAGSVVAGTVIWPALVWGPLLAVVSVVGDLTVSAFKRNAGLKDTGRILPGHGGIMDRVDSLVAAAPFFVIILSFLRF